MSGAKNNILKNIIVGVIFSVVFAISFLVNPVFAETDFSEWIEITNSTTSISEDGNYYLNDDITTNILVKEDVNATIDLNGHVLCGGNNATVIFNKGYLTIVDSSPTTIHYFEVSADGVWKWNKDFNGTPDYVYENGILKKGDPLQETTVIPPSGTVIAVSGGCITGGKGYAEGTHRYAGGITNGDTSTLAGTTSLKLDGINIIGNTSTARCGGIGSYHKIVCNNVNILGNRSDKVGGGLYCDASIDSNSATNYCEVNNTNIKYNAAVEQAGGFYSSLKTKVYQSSISYNKCGGLAGGAIVWASDDVLFEQCDISYNTAGTIAGGIFARRDAKTTIKDCSITHNTSDIKGGGIYFGGDGETVNRGLTIIGTTIGTEISNNITLTADNGGGIYCEKTPIEQTFTISGNVTCQDNTSNSIKNNLYIVGGKLIDLSNHSSGLIGISSSETPTDSNPIIITNPSSNDCSSYLVSDNDKYLVSGDGSDSNKVVILEKIGDYVAAIGSKKYSTVQEAVVAALSGETVKMIADSVENITIDSDKEMTLDLNGHVLKSNGGTVITNNGTLTIKDSNPFNKHYFEVDENGKWCLIDKPTDYSKLSAITSIVAKGTKIEIEGGCITGGSGSAPSGNPTFIRAGGIYNETGATINLEGGVLVGNTANDGGAVCNYGDFNMKDALVIGNYGSLTSAGFRNNGNMAITGGCIRNNTSKIQGGAINNHGGNLTIKGTSSNRVRFLYNCEKTDSGDCGGGAICLKSTNANTEVSIMYCDFIGNRSERHGGAILFNTAGTLEVSECLFNDNSTLRHGGAISVHENVTNLTIKDSIFTNNEAGMNGGAIWAMRPFTCSGNTEIKDNNASASTSLGGGVCVEGDLITLGDSVKILDNTINNTTQNNLYLCEGKVVVLLDGFNGSIGISTAIAPTDNNPVTITKTTSTDYSSNLISDDDKFLINNSGTDANQIILLEKIGDYVAVIGSKKFLSVQEAVNSASSGQTVKMIKNSVENVVVLENKNITLDLNGYVLSGDGTDSAIKVKGANFVVKDSSTTSYNYFAYKKDGAWIWEPDKESGILISKIDSDTLDGTIIKIKGGAITGGIRNNNGSYFGGGISISTTSSYDAKLTLESGNIIGNFSFFGAGVWLGNKFESDGRKISFVMSGGSIIGNYALGNGGGVLIKDNASFILESGSIAYNHAHEDGGGIGAEGTSKISIKKDGSGNKGDGVISYNVADDDGGGIYTYGSVTLNLSSGTIKNNAAAEYGGGICFYNNSSEHGTFKMDGGTISNNYARISGGGVYNSCKFIMDGGTISYNKTDYDGGGVYQGAWSAFEMNAGTISYNTAGQDGGGVNVHRYESNVAKFDMNGGTISNNTADESGGGVYLQGELTLSGQAKITGNKKGTAKNNLYVIYEKTVSIADGFNGSVGVTTSDSPVNAAIAITGNNSIDYTSCFASDSKNYAIANGNKNMVEVVYPTCMIISQDAYNGKKFGSIKGALYNVVDNVATTIKLIADDCEKEFVISSDKIVTIDLNGFILKQKADENRQIWNEGNLTITDSNPTKAHSFKVGSNGVWSLVDLEPTCTINSLTGIPEDNTIVEVYGGCITGGYSSDISIDGLAIMNADSASLNILGGNIIGHNSQNYGTIYNKKTGTITMSGGRIVGNRAWLGGGIYNEGDVNISSAASILCNYAYNSGGGIYNITVDNNDVANINMTGGKIFGNRTYQYSGAGIQNEGKLDISGNAIISNNECAGGSNGHYGGAGIFNNVKGTVTISGSTKITKNRGTGYRNSGSGLYNSGTATISGSTEISNNYNTWEYGFGGGIYNHTGATLTIKDDAVISGNYTTAEKGNGGGIYNAGTLNIFDNVEITNNHVGYVNDTNINAFGGGIYNDGDLTIGGNVSVNNNTTSDYYGFGGGIYNASNLIVQGNAEVTSNFSCRGGGIYNEGLFTLSGNADVFDNTSGTDGGGIYNIPSILKSDTGIVTINGGSIHDNNTIDDDTRGGDGGGIFNDGKLIINASLTISNNSANSRGGGIANSGAGVITINSGFGLTIQNNEAGKNGGGIYNFGVVSLPSTSTLTITGNSSKENGGGISNEAESQNNQYINFVGTTIISNNTALNNGGGVYNHGPFTIGGSINITNNTSNSQKNNFYVADGEVIYLSDSVNLLNTSKILISCEDVNDFNSVEVVHDGKDFIDSGIFNVDSDCYYLSVNANDIYMNGRITTQPSKLNNYFFDVKDNKYNGTLTYQWYRIVNGNDKKLTGNTANKLDLSNIVFGNYKCVVSYKSDTQDDFDLTSSTVSIIPSIVAQPNENNDYLFDVDTNKCATNNVAVSYEWFKTVVNPNQMTIVDDEKASILTSARCQEVFGSPFTVSISGYNSQDKVWKVDANGYFAIELEIDAGQKLVVSSKCFDMEETMFYGAIYKINDQSSSLYSYFESGYCGTIVEDGTYVILGELDTDENITSYDVSVGLFETVGLIDQEKVNIVSQQQSTALFDVDPITYDQDGYYNVTKNSGVITVDLNAGETVYVVPDNAKITGYILQIDNSATLLGSYVSKVDELGYTALETGTYYIYSRIYDSVNKEYVAGRITINVVGGETQEKVNAITDSNLHDVDYGTYKAIATYTDTTYSDIDTCTLTSDAFDYKMQLFANDTTVNNKAYDGTNAGTAVLSTITGIKTEDADDVEVTVSSVTFDSINIGNNVSTTVAYAISGDAAYKYRKPVNSTTLKANITPKVINVVADSKTMKNGETVPTFTSQVTGLIGTDSINYDYKALTPTQQGVYSIIPFGDQYQGNYEVKFTKGILVVKPSPAEENASVRTDMEVLGAILSEYKDDPEYEGKDLYLELNTNYNIPAEDSQKIYSEVGSNYEVYYYNNQLYLVIKDQLTADTDFKDLGDEITVLVPIYYDFDYTNKYDIHVYRVHKDSLEEITIQPNALGEFIELNKDNDEIVIWAKKYSTYSIAFKEYDASAPHTHDYKNTTVLPTCTQSGLKIETCDGCNSVIKTTLKALGHKYEEKTIEGDCSHEGKVIQTCTRCGEMIETVIPSFGHNFDEQVILEPDCVNEGKTIRTCNTCGEQEEVVTPALGHRYSGEWIIEKEASFTYEGSKYEVCTVCGEVHYESIDRLPITESPVAVAVASATGVSTIAAAIAVAVKNKAAIAAGQKALSIKPKFKLPKKTLVLCLKDNTFNTNIIELIKTKKYIDIKLFPYREIEAIPRKVAIIHPNLVIFDIHDKSEMETLVKNIKATKASYGTTFGVIVSANLDDSFRQEMDKLKQDGLIMNYTSKDDNIGVSLVKLVLPLYKLKKNKSNIITNISAVCEALGLPMAATVARTYTTYLSKKSLLKDTKRMMKKDGKDASDAVSIIANVAQILGYSQVRSVSEFLEGLNDTKKTEIAERLRNNQAEM